jgi:hypothetical protein
MLPIRDNHPLRQLFGGLVEHAFQRELGICDPALADYLSELLVQFVHIDELTIARDAAGRPLGEIADLIGRHEVAADAPLDVRSRFVHRRIGDYALFWTGVYPESVRRSSGASWRDVLVDYVTYGKRSYAIASELTPPEAEPPADLLRNLSEHFEFCVHGLGLVRAGLDSPNLADSAGSDLIY